MLFEYCINNSVINILFSDVHIYHLSIWDFNSKNEALKRFAYTSDPLCTGKYHLCDTAMAKLARGYSRDL